MDIQPFRIGSLEARFAASPEEREQAQRLRQKCFSAGPLNGLDADQFDPGALHGLVFHEGRLVCCFRLRLWQGDAVETSYTAQFYDLSALVHFDRRMLELGRFCIEPGTYAADALRLAWALITAVVDANQIGILFGCTSFSGANPEKHAASLSLLKSRIGPDDLLPKKRASQVVELSNLAAPFNPSQALAGVPPLLRSYLGMGGWVSDHAVIDLRMDTLHVFTGLEVSRIPPERARALRTIAQECLG